MRRPGYEMRLLVLLSLTNGVVALERLSASFLSPYLVADLGLTNTQLGLLSGALSGAVAVSAMAFGRIADATGLRKGILLGATIAFSLIAGLPALVGGFGGLLLARFVLGLAEGPVVPLSQSMMAASSDPRRRALNMGILQMAGAFLLGGTLGPIVATRIADAYGWRAAFSFSVLPGLVVALLLWRVVRPDPAGGDRASKAERDAAPAGQDLRELLAIRNVRLMILISGLFAAWYTIQNVFLPLYLVSVKGLAPATMGWVVGAGGIGGLVGGMGVPALADVFGRKPVMIACSFLGVVAPAAVLLLPPEPVLLAGAVMLGWIIIGISPLYIGVVPSESAPAGLVTSAIGLATASGELLGGLAAPALAGRLADQFGLTSVFHLCVLLALIGGVACCTMRETRVASPT